MEFVARAFKVLNKARLKEQFLHSSNLWQTTAMITHYVSAQFYGI